MRALRAAAGGALVLGAALAGAGCGPRLETDPTTSARTECDAHQASADPAENCALYCGAYDCLECAAAGESCRTACLGNVASARPGDCLFTVLGCAVENIHLPGLIDSLSCSDDHSTTFVITLPDTCPTCP